MVEASEVGSGEVVVSLVAVELIESPPPPVPQAVRSGTTAAELSRTGVASRIVSPSFLRTPTDQAGQDDRDRKQQPHCTPPVVAERRTPD